MPTGSTSIAGPFARAVSAEIRAEMGRLKMSGNQLAQAVGLSQNYVAIRLRDAKPFNLNDVHEIAHALGIDVFEIMVRAENNLDQAYGEYWDAIGETQTDGPAGHDPDYSQMTAEQAEQYGLAARKGERNIGMDDTPHEP